MDAGRLDQRLILKSKVSGKDTIGGETISWTNVVTVWGAAEPMRGREFLVLQEAESDLVVRFTIYYRTDITSAWRVEWRGQDYEIEGPPIDVLGGKRWIELMARSAQT